MVVICPKCKVRLKVAEEKISPAGTRFKCPKCSTVLLVKRPVAQARPLDSRKVLVAHEDPDVLSRVRTVLNHEGYNVIPLADGIEAMVQAVKELPFLAVLSVSLPKIYGFEVSSRLKKRPETRDMKIILVASLYDKNRYRREPASFYGADDYIEEHQIEELLIGKIDSILGRSRAEEAPAEAAAGAPATTGRPEPAAEPGPPSPETRAVPANDKVEKARRLARTIVADIYLYNPAKVEEAIRNGTFQITFASDLREGLKLYDNRVSEEVRRLGDFFNEAINDFIDKKKQSLS